MPFFSHKNKDEDEVEEEGYNRDVGEFAILPPDGGWGWVVVAAALYCNAVVDGILFTFGIFMLDMMKTYDTKETNIALIASLMYGVHLMAGPLCSALTKAFGIRPLVVFGSILVSVSFATAALEPPLWLLTILFGICAGIGLCFVYMLSITVTAIYFTRLRILAVGIVVCGTGLGTLVFAQASRQMLKNLNWKESQLILSGLALIMALAGLSFKPLQPLRINTSNKISLEKFKSTVSLTTLWDADLEQQPIVIITKSRRNSITSAIDATHVALGIYSDGLFEEKEFLKDDLATMCGRWFYCFQPRGKVLLMNPKMKRNILSEDDEKTKWSIKQLLHNYDGRWERIVNSFKNMKWSLLKEIEFILFCISGSFTATAIIIIFTFESAHFISTGYSEDDATLMITVLGASNMCWRLLLGVTSLFPKVNYHALNVTGHCIAGIVTIAFVLSTNQPFSYVYCFILGIGLGCFAVFRPVLLLEIVGMENLPDATGINLFFNGLLAITGPPIGGLMHSMTGNYYLTYILAGLLFLTSGILLIFITGNKPIIKRPESQNPIPSTSTQ